MKHDPKEINDNFDVMIVDEATLAKNTSTKRFKLIHKIAKNMEYVILLSGMPMMNGAAEIYAPLLLLDSPLVARKRAEGKKAFEKIFAGGHYRQIRSIRGISKERLKSRWWMFYSWWAKGANNVRELRWLIRDQFFFMEKSETGIFKNKTRQFKLVPMSPGWLIEYTRAWSDYLKIASKRSVDMENVMDLRKLIENGQCYQVNSKRKAKIVAKDIADGKYGDRRIVVFTLFVESDEILQAELKSLGVSFRTFDDVQAWKDGTEQVLVGRIKSNGKGSNLQESSLVIFVDMDFVPANNIQCENRIDRPEQTKDMEVIYYLTEGDDVVDKHVRNINRNKLQKIHKFMQHLTPEELKEMPSRVESLSQKFSEETELLGISYPQAESTTNMV